MYRRWIWGTLFIGLLLQTTISAETLISSPPQKLTLTDCINLALKNDPDLKLYQAQAGQKAARLKQTESSLYPKIDLNVGYTRYETINKTADPFSSINTYNLQSGDLTLQQLLFDFGKTGSAINRDRYFLDQANFDMEQQKLDTIYTVKKMVFDILKNQQLIEAKKQSIEKYQQQYQSAKTMFLAGKKAQYDVLKAELNLKKEETQLITYQKDLSASIIALSNNLRIALTTTNIDIDPQLTMTPVNLPATASAVEQALKSRPDLKALVSQKKAIESTISSIMSENNPALNGFAGYNGNGSVSPLSQGWQIGAKLSWNLFSGFMRPNQIEENQQLIKYIDASIEKTTIKMMINVTNAYLNIREAEQLLKEAKTGLDLAEEGINLANLKYQSGSGTMLEITEAMSNLRDAQLTRISAIYNYQLALAELERYGIKESI